MKVYLRGEARWAREQALSAERKAADLRDPSKIAQLRKAAALDLARAKTQARLDVSNARNAVVELAEDQVDRLIDQHEKDARYWTQLAEGHEARLAASDDAGLFDQEVGA